MRKAVFFACRLTLFLFSLIPLAYSESPSGMQELQSKIRDQDVLIQKQQVMIQQLAEKMTALEAKVEGHPSSQVISPQPVDLQADELPALPPYLVEKETEGFGKLPLEIGGYLDVGYIDGAGSGDVSTSALHINSRGDTLSSVGLDGDSSFLVNAMNLKFRSAVSPALDVLFSVNFLPRKLTYTASGGTALSDTFDVDLAYVSYRPFAESENKWKNLLFGDLKISLGKFESPWGIEYRFNESPDRVNISRSMMSIYWTGYPVGVKARGKILKDLFKQFLDSALSYTLALTNAEPWLATLVDGDRATNKRRTLTGRLAYGLEVFGASLESGISMAHGARINQGDEVLDQNSLGIDGQIHFRGFTVRAEYDNSNLDRPRSGTNPTAIHFSHYYIEGFYEIPRFSLIPEWLPYASLTPYYRYDVRDFNTMLNTGLGSQQAINRHTFALRYGLWPGGFLKGEFQMVGEAENASFNDNSFLMSYVQEF